MRSPYSAGGAEACAFVTAWTKEPEPGVTSWIQDGVARVTVRSRTLRPAHTTNVYWVVSDGQALIVDMGARSTSEAEKIIQSWRWLGSPDVVAIVITHEHRDHVENAVYVAERLGTTIRAHKRTLAAIHRLRSGQTNRFATRLAGLAPLPEDGGWLYVGGRRLQVIHVPGHSPGHVNFLLPANAAGSVLFAGDTCSGLSSVGVFAPTGNMAAYLTSLDRLIALQPDRLAPGHGDILAPGADVLRYFKEHRLARETAILRELQLHPHGLRLVDLTRLVYSEPSDPGVNWMTLASVRAHLVKLQAEDRVVMSGRGPLGRVRGT